MVFPQDNLLHTVWVATLCGYLPYMGVVVSHVLTFVLYVMLASLQAEVTLTRSKSQRKPGEMLEKAADLIMSCFRVCVSDR